MNKIGMFLSIFNLFYHIQALSCCVVMPESDLVLVGSWDNNLYVRKVVDPTLVTVFMIRVILLNINFACCLFRLPSLKDLRVSQSNWTHYYCYLCDELRGSRR